MRLRYHVLFTGAAFLCAASGQAADDVLSASPFGVVTIAAEEAATLQMPVLEYTATPEDDGNYDKYYFFIAKRPISQPAMPMSPSAMAMPERWHQALRAQMCLIPMPERWRVRQAASLRMR